MERWRTSKFRANKDVGIYTSFYNINYFIFILNIKVKEKRITPNLINFLNLLFYNFI